MNRRFIVAGLIPLMIAVSGCANTGAATKTPDPTLTPLPTETPLPKPSATFTPEPMPTETLEPAATTEATEAPTEAAPTALRYEKYTHPSGAFSFNLPNTWQIMSEASDQTLILDESTPSILMAFVFDVGAEFGPSEFSEFAASSVPTMMSGVSRDFEVVEQGLVPENENQYSAFLNFTSPSGGGQAEFIYTYEDRVVFLLAFISADYFGAIPIWDQIRLSHQIDASAVEVSP